MLFILVLAATMETYYTPDLYTDDHQIFKVNFDLFTPRPHFIILFKENENKPRTFNDLSPEERKGLVEVAKTMVTSYKLKEKSALSIHRGSWCKSHFHGHICVDVNGYLKVYDNRKDEIINLDYFIYGPNKKNKKWKISKKNYEDNVRAYPYKSYHEYAVGQIEELEEKSTYYEENSSLDSESFLDFKLIYHPSQPRIGFFTDKTPVSLLRCMDAMDKFAGKFGLAKKWNKDLGDDDGCHMCLALDRTHDYGEKK